MHEREITDLSRMAFDSLPLLAFIVDQDVRVQECNAAASEILSAEKTTIIKQRTGYIFHCLHSHEAGGCGEAPYCNDCIIRNSVAEALQGNRVVRRHTKIEIERDGNQTKVYGLITAVPFSLQGRPVALLVIEDISELPEIARTIPICSVCKKVRDEKEVWTQVENYFKDKLGVSFTHSICPDCYKIEIDKLRELILSSPPPWGHH